MTDFTKWLIGGERGISSDAIVSQLTGIPLHRQRHSDHPHDSDDFMRCAKLLAMYPEAMDDFREKMPSRSPVWSALVERWGDIHHSLNSEIPGYLLHKARGSTPKTYQLMREIIGSVERNTQ